MIHRSRLLTAVRLLLAASAAGCLVLLLLTAAYCHSSSQRHTIVGDASRRGLSGGQRKRVNVGLELVADPSLIFLDEPTSGLDSTAALELMHALHRLSNFGVAVCAVLHQPRLQVHV